MNDLLQLPVIKPKKHKVKIDKALAFVIAGTIAEMIQSGELNAGFQDILTDVYNELIKRINNAYEKQIISIKLRYYQAEKLMDIMSFIPDKDPYFLAKKQEVYKQLHKLCLTQNK